MEPLPMTAAGCAEVDRQQFQREARQSKQTGNL
jgi:hypothetical protein